MSQKVLLAVNICINIYMPILIEVTFLIFTNIILFVVPKYQYTVSVQDFVDLRNLDILVFSVFLWFKIYFVKTVLGLYGHTDI